MLIEINNQKLDTDKLNQYIVGDSTKLFKELGVFDPFIDLIVTSPPYWDMKQYGEISEQIGHGQNYKSYLNDIKNIFTDVYNYSKDHATLFLNCDTMKRDGKMVRLPDDIASVLEEVGWVHQDTIIWNKVKTLPWSRKGQMRNVFEYILMFTKEGRNDYKYHIERIKTVDDLMEWWVDYPERYNPEGKAPTNIWEHVIPTQGSWGSKQDFGEEEFKHACPFPPELMNKLILLSSDENDVVFDPFAGTGILLATAEKLNRRYLGFDTNPDYQKVFEKVTKKLLSEEWEIIDNKYKEQDRKKQILKETIYKLRALKYPKALVKRIRNLHSKDLINFKNDIKLILAFDEELTEEEKNDSKIGKVKYTFILGNESTLEEAKLIINNILSKPPFTKYGLQIQFDVKSIEEMENYVNYIDHELYSYERGCTNSYSRVVNLSEIGTIPYFQLFDKDIPPIISNIKIHEDDYADIERIEYKKR